MTARTWSTGDAEPPAPEVTEVTDRLGHTWLRSKPNGLYWFPATGGLIWHWPELVKNDGPLVEVITQWTLFDMHDYVVQ